LRLPPPLLHTAPRIAPFLLHDSNILEAIKSGRLTPTREWQKRGASEDKDYSILSNIISQETFGVGVKRHKEVKGLSSQNLRDHMTDLELILTMLRGNIDGYNYEATRRTRRLSVRTSGYRRRKDRWRRAQAD
jgi:hypothetical protein